MRMQRSIPWWWCEQSWTPRQQTLIQTRRLSTSLSRCTIHGLGGRGCWICWWICWSRPPLAWSPPFLGYGCIVRRQEGESTTGCKGFLLTSSQIINSTESTYGSLLNHPATIMPNHPRTLPKYHRNIPETNLEHPRNMSVSQSISQSVDHLTLGSLNYNTPPTKFTISLFPTKFRNFTLHYTARH